MRTQFLVFSPSLNISQTQRTTSSRNCSPPLDHLFYWNNSHLEPDCLENSQVAGRYLQTPSPIRLTYLDIEAEPWNATFLGG